MQDPAHSPTEPAADAALFQSTQELLSQGVVVFPPEDSPVSSDEWRRLEQATSLERCAYEHVVEGDTGEPNDVRVARFVTDLPTPQRTDHPAAAEVLDVIASPHLMALYERLVGAAPLHVRRCQAHVLTGNGFIGLHTDAASNPDYLVAVLFHLGDDYEGGAFVAHCPGGARLLRLRPRSLLINRAALPHEVQPVRRGFRRTLACFLATERRPNPRLAPHGAH